MNQRPPVHYRVGSDGALNTIPAAGLDSDLWHALRTMTGVEWYDAVGNWTDAPLPPDASASAYMTPEWLAEWEVENARSRWPDRGERRG